MTTIERVVREVSVVRLAGGEVIHTRDAARRVLDQFNGRQCGYPVADLSEEDARATLRDMGALDA